MKYSFLVVAIALALSLCGVAHARPPMTDEEWEQYQQADMQFKFQQFGADPETARWAVWAIKHQPSSRCALSAIRAYSAMRGDSTLFPGQGEGMVTDHICEPAALREDALKPPMPQSDKEVENERLQWGVTNADRARVAKALADKSRKDEIERRKHLGTPYYLTSPNNPNFVDPCRFIKLGFDSAAEANDAGTGAVNATCRFELGTDNYWRVKGCDLVPEKGTSQEIMDASKKYLSSVCWSKDNFRTELDKNGVGTMHLSFTLGE